MNSRDSLNNLIETTGFREFITFVNSKYNDGAEFTVKEVLGEDFVKYLNEKGISLVQLGRLITNNITNGNITGLEALSKKSMNIRVYRKTSKVSVRGYFSTDFTNENIDKQNLLDSELYIECEYAICKGTNIQIDIKTYNNKNGERTYTFNKKLGNFGYNKIEDNYKDFAEIQSAWYGLDRAYEEITSLNNDITTVYLIVKNENIARVVSGQYNSIDKTTDKYNAYIQDNFKWFIKGELKEISPCIVIGHK